MKLSGYAFRLSDDSEVLISPQQGVSSCTAVHDDFEITIDVANGSFQARPTKERAQALGVLSFRKAEFEVPDGGLRADDGGGNVGVLWCRASGCCCNCGSGWVCG